MLPNRRPRPRIANGTVARAGADGKGPAMGLIEFLVGDDLVIRGLREAAHLGAIDAQPDEWAQGQFVPSGPK